MSIENIENNIEVAIVMDVTGSMQRWIDSAYETVLESFATLQKEHPDASFRLGCVCYRDIGDSVPFVVSPFTNDLQLVKTTLKETRASGGDDTAEDIAGALEKVLDMEWSENAIKIVLWVADAPAHGTKYHALTLGDRFPKGDPNGREPSVQVKTLAKRDIDLTMFRVDHSIDKMVEIFANVYDEAKAEAPPGEFDATFTLLDIAKQEHLFSSMSASSSLTSGFIDLASYDTYRSAAPTAIFRTATEDAVRSAISKRSSSSASK